MKVRRILISVPALLRMAWVQAISIPFRTMPIQLAGRGDFELPLSKLGLLGYEAFEDEAKFQIPEPMRRANVLLRFNEGWEALSQMLPDQISAQQRYERALAKWVRLADDPQLKDSLILLNNLACLTYELAIEERHDLAKQSQKVKRALDAISEASSLLRSRLEWFRESERTKVEIAVKQNRSDIAAPRASPFGRT